MTLKPNAFFVGAPKAGTSAMSVYLGRHPQICVSRIKESNYFCLDLDLVKPKSETEYLSLFRILDQTTVVLDASILSLYSKRAAAAISDYSPKAKILIMLRDPVEAMYAWHSQMVLASTEPIADFAQALKQEESRKRGEGLPTVGMAVRCPNLLFYREVMNYASQIECYLEHFGRSQIHVEKYDDFKKTPHIVFQRILNFLEVNTSFKTEFERINAHKERKAKNIHYILKKLFAEKARRYLAPTLRLKLINVVDLMTTRQAHRKQMDENVRSSLRQDASVEVEKLSLLLDMDFSEWSA